MPFVIIESASTLNRQSPSLYSGSNHRLDVQPSMSSDSILYLESSPGAVFARSMIYWKRSCGSSNIESSSIRARRFSARDMDGYFTENRGLETENSAGVSRGWI